MPDAGSCEGMPYCWDVRVLSCWTNLQIQGHMRPHMGAPDGEVEAAVAPVELLCAEADQALQQLQGYGSAAPSWTSSSEDSAGSAQERGDAKSSLNSGRRILGAPLDEQSMWVDEQIAEAELLRQLEDSDSPVEPIAQLSLPMFPDLAHLDGRPDAAQHNVSSTLPDSRSGSKEEDASREAMSGTVGCLGSPWAAVGGAHGSLSSAASMPDLEENFVTPVGSPRKQAASAPPVLDLRFARSDSLVSAASQPACHPNKHSLPCSGSGGLLSWTSLLGAGSLWLSADTATSTLNLDWLIMRHKADCRPAPAMGVAHSMVPDAAVDMCRRAVPAEQLVGGAASGAGRAERRHAAQGPGQLCAALLPGVLRGGRAAEDEAPAALPPAAVRLSCVRAAAHVACLTWAQMRFGPGEIRGLRGLPSGKRLSWTGRLTSAGSVEGGCV